MQIIVFYCFPLLLALATVWSSTAAADDAQSTAVIAAVILEDVTAFSSESLLPAYAESLGRLRTPTEERALRDRVVSLYSDAGFLPPAVLLQLEEEKAANIVRLKVIESAITQVHPLGFSPAQTSSIQRQIQVLQTLQPVAFEDIENFRADVEVTLNIRLDTDLVPLANRPSEYRLEFKARPSVSGELIYTAEGSQSLGRHMAGATLTVSNPVQGVSELYLTALHTIETDGYGNFGAGSTVPLSDAHRLQLDFSNARAVPQYAFASKGTRYRRHWSRLQYVHDFRSNREEEIDLYFALSMRNYEREEFGLVSLDEQLRLVDFGMRAITGSATLAFRTDVNVRVGLNELGARRRDIFSDEAQDLSFRLLGIDYTIWQSLPVGFSVKLDFSGQYSPQQLPYSQRFSMGGGTFFYAYEAGEFSGDSGLGSRVEFRRSIDTEVAGLSRLVPYVYYGIASAYENLSESSQSAAGAGAGLRLSTNSFSAFLEVAQPLTQSSEYKGTDARATGRITYTF